MLNLTDDKLEEYAALAEQGPILVMIPKDDIAVLYREILRLRKVAAGAHFVGVVDAVQQIVDTAKTALLAIRLGASPCERTEDYLERFITEYEQALVMLKGLVEPTKGT